MIRLHGVSLRRGTRELLHDATLRLHDGERVGVIGPNGCGKSTLFALLTGTVHSDAGHCDIPADWPIAQMDQEVPGSPQAAIDFVLDGHHEYRVVQAAIDAGADGAELAELHDRLNAIEGWSVPSRAHELLAGLGFPPEQHTQAVAAFSGGWRTRLALARALMTPSRLLLLDEPTNHLDLDAIQWLESWLIHYQGTLLLISHDRDFLDAVVNRVLVFEGRHLGSYRGNYSDWERQRGERLATQQASFDKQQQRIREIEAFVARFRAKASKARQAQSRLKELERMQRISPAHVDSPFHFTLPCADKVSTPLLSLEDACLGYGDKTLLGPVNLSLLPGQRVGLLGPNGAGKSTLVRHLAGEFAPQRGARHAGDQLRCGYFAQHQLEALDPNASPLRHLQRLDPRRPEQQLRDFIGGYGFAGDMALTTVHRFSGGERARLALALLAWQKPNLLLLDEPTNHLDLEMRHALVLALQEYPGAVLLVSHDRHLLRNSVDEFWLVLDGKVTAFDGDLSAYQTLMANRSRTPLEDTPPVSENNRRRERQLAAQRREILRPLRQHVQRLEQQMHKVQQALARIEIRLADNSLYVPGQADTLTTLQQEQGQLRQQLADCEEEWLNAVHALESASDARG